MRYNTRLFYTPALEPHEFNDRALILDTETIGSGPHAEVIEVALGDTRGRVLYESLVRPVFNPLPPLYKHKRFVQAGFADAPEWPDVWPQISALINNKLLIAYNAAFDRRLETGHSQLSRVYSLICNATGKLTFALLAMEYAEEPHQPAAELSNVHHDSCPVVATRAGARLVDQLWLRAAPGSSKPARPQTRATM